MANSTGFWIRLRTGATILGFSDWRRFVSCSTASRFSGLLVFKTFFPLDWKRSVR
jgi:hypothetical protein